MSTATHIILLTGSTLVAVAAILLASWGGRK
jgi:hypothetical protein